jgi:hypothetical protein
VTTRASDAAAWHGPASVLGAVAGLAIQAVPWVLGVPGFPWPLFLLTVATGVVVLPLRGPVRQAGVGLVASATAVPVALASYALSGLILA